PANTAPCGFAIVFSKIHRSKPQNRLSTLAESADQFSAEIRRFMVGCQAELVSLRYRAMLREPTNPPAFILLERSGANAICFRRYFSNCPIVETRSWVDCGAELDNRPGSVAGISVQRSEWAAVAARIANLRIERRNVAVVGLVDRNDFRSSTSGAVQLLYEFGCGFVAESPFDIPYAARFVTRHLAQQPQRTATIRERIWQDMPWRSADFNSLQ
ncbi:MAG: hypothetical protein KDB27_33225, partial [Planctomycetales bacterium]|nr:hypothetical protein [Planctomycetales bacterium]